MTDDLRSLVLACAVVVACKAAPEPAPLRVAFDEASVGAVESELETRYAPTRSSPGSYSWQIPLPARCDARDTWGSGKRLKPINPDVVVASLRSRLRRCYSSWLERQADAGGSVRFNIELGCTGQVEALLAQVESVDPLAVACLFGIIGPARFEPPANGHATIQVPVVFKNTDAPRF